MTEYLLGKNPHTISVSLMNLQEFSALKGNYPHKRELIHSMEQAVSCKAEVYAQCLFGVLKIPDKKNLEKKPWIAAWYFMKNKLIFLDDGGQISRILEKIKDMEFLLVLLLNMNM